MSKKTKVELEAENKFLRKQSRYYFATAIGTQAIKWCGLVLIAWMGYKAIAVLSGKQTQANILVSFLGDVRVSQVLSWGLAVGGLSYGSAQARLRKTKEAALGERIKELEQELDPRRSSSR
jgi:hypothetical protein